MNRSPVTLREAVCADAEQLADLWVDLLRRSDEAARLADLVTIIERCLVDPKERIMVAEYDGQVAGAVHLRVGTMSSLNLDPVVQALSPHVFPKFRRRGIGRALMESGVAFAEESGVALVGTATTSASRDANRFMARLALAPQAIMRVAPTQLVRAKLTAQRPVTGRAGGRQISHVLAARRSLRKAQAPRVG